MRVKSRDFQNLGRGFLQKTKKKFKKLNKNKFFKLPNLLNKLKRWEAI